MPIEAKAMLLRGLEQKLSSEIAASDMAKVMSIAADLLQSYELIQIDLSGQTKDDLLDAYITAMQIQGRSEKTIRRYEYIIKRMMANAQVPTRMITVYHLRRYLANEKSRGISDRTLEGIRQVFSAYFNWLQREGLIETNPSANLGAIRFPKKQKDIYSETDLEKLKMHCSSQRDLAILCFLKATGCRISEMTNLNRADVDLTSLECRVMGKGAKERTVYLDPVAGMTLQTYLDERKDESDALFVGKGSERLQPGAVRRVLTKLGELAHVDHVHPHKFRRTTATNLIRHGMPIQEVAAILGHDKLDTTMQYVVLNKTDIKNAYQKYI